MIETIGILGGQIFFWLVILISIILVPLGLPGTFLIVVAVLLHGYFTGFVPFTVSLILWLFLIAVVGELIEFFFGAASAKKFGGSRNAMWGAVLGGFAGAVFGSGITPVVGTVIGAFLGAFCGAALFEYVTNRDSGAAIRVGFGAFLGALGGRFTKLILAIIMVLITAINFF